MTDYTKLAKKLDAVNDAHGSQAVRDAAAILRQLSAVDVAGVMDLARKWVSHPFSTKNRIALEVAVRALAARQTKALTVDELEALWNAQADQFNQWDDLGVDEIVNFAQAVHGIKETP